MTWVQTLLIVLGFVALLYLIGFVYVVNHTAIFARKARKQMEAMSVIFTEKKEMLLTLFAHYDEAEAPIDVTEKEAAQQVRWLKTDAKTAADVAAIEATLSDLQKRLILLAEKESYLKAGDDFKWCTATLRDLDANYRRIVAVYNAAVGGYEYWRKNFLYFPFIWLFGFHKKEHII